MKQVIYSSEVKKTAKEAMAGKLGVAILVLLVWTVLTQSASMLDSGMQYSYMIEHMLSGESFINDNVDTGKITFNTGMESMISTTGYETPAWLSILSMVESILTIPVTVGAAFFFLNYIRGNNVEIGMLFAKYSNFVKILLVNIYKNVLIVLFTLLFIIPGIIAAYSYALTDYILADDDTIGVAEAVTQSKEMMKGHKFQLFCLQLSFIGWFILSGFTLGILYIAYVGPYYNCAMAAFYETIKNENKQEVISQDESFGNFNGSIY